MEEEEKQKMMLTIDSLNKDEDTILASRVKNGMIKLELMQELIKKLEEEEKKKGGK